MEHSHRRKERLYLKLIFGALLGLFLLIALIWSGRDLYARWQERRLIRRAVAAMEHGDDATASLAARTVLQIKPTSASAARIVAEIAEKAGNRVALDWRRKAVEFDPRSVNDALALARCALQFNEPGLAEQALAGIDEQGKQTAGFHAVIALQAQTRRDDETAAREWERAVQLAPNQTDYQLQLGMQQLRSGNENQRDAGKAILTKLREDQKQRAAATRALISDGIAQHESAQQLLALAKDLQSYPEATLNDRLMYLDFLHQAQLPEYAGYLTKFQADVVDNPTELGALLEWMSKTNQNLLALDFVKQIAPEKLEKWPVPMAIARLYAQLADWNKLEAVTKDANWRQAEFMRHAYLARALRGRDKPAAVEHEWGQATKQAGNQSASILALIQVTKEWHWEKEMVDLLWSLTADPERQREAIQALYQYYGRTQDTQGLYRILVRWAEIAPDNLNIQNNYAQVALLLDANRDEARKIAADLYQKAPTNAAYAATYAYSLLTKGDARQAAKVLTSLTPEQLRDPAVSAYYGLCLAALHDDKARDFLAAGQQAALLPEEKKLIDKALASLNSR